MLDQSGGSVEPLRWRGYRPAKFSLDHWWEVRFGEQGVVELGTIVGYYTAIGNALNAFQVPLPAGASQPFPE